MRGDGFQDYKAVIMPSSAVSRGRMGKAKTLMPEMGISNPGSAIRYLQ